MRLSPSDLHPIDGGCADKDPTNGERRLVGRARTATGRTKALAGRRDGDGCWIGDQMPGNRSWLAILAYSPQRRDLACLLQ